MVDATLLAKIDKMLELAKRGGTEEEADTAMKMVHEMLAKYNLSLEDVEAARTTDEDEIVDESEPGKNRCPWQDYVYHAIAKLYFCMHIKERKYVYGATLYETGKHVFMHRIVGKPSNVAVVRHMAKYLIDVAEKLSKQGQGRSYANSFKKGFSLRIARRVEDEIAEAKAGHLHDDTGKAMILSPLYDKSKSEIEAYLASIGMRTTTTRRAVTAGNMAGYRAGQEAGDKVSLKGNGIGGGASPVARLGR